MLFFGHTGITVGLFWLANKVIRRNRRPPSSAACTHAGHSNTLPPALDYRFAFVGSLLPDIIDKPTGQLLLRESISNGRIFAHTLLFVFLLLGAGCILYGRRGATWLLVLALGSSAHLAQDRIWESPVTMFWPLLGLDFPRLDLHDWPQGLLQRLLENPSVYIPELVGLSILLAATGALLVRGSIMAFLRRGYTS